MLSYQTFITFPNLSILTLCCLVNFCHLIKPLSSYQTFVIFSPFLIYSLFVLYTHHLNAPVVRTTNTTLFQSYRAHALCANTTFLLTRRLWPSCHSDYGGIGPWLGVSSKNKQICFRHVEEFIHQILAAFPGILRAEDRLTQRRLPLRSSCANSRQKRKDPLCQMEIYQRQVTMETCLYSWKLPASESY